MATGLWMYSAKAFDLQDRLEVPVEIATEDRTLKMPLQGFWQPVRQVISSDQFLRGNFHDVQESYDERGAKIYVTTWQDGAKTIQFNDPRIQL